MFIATPAVVFISLGLVTVCYSESLPIPNALSIVSISRSSNVGINDGVNSLVNRHKSCPEGYELGTVRIFFTFYLFIAAIMRCDKLYQVFTRNGFYYNLIRKGQKRRKAEM